MADHATSGSPAALIVSRMIGSSHGNEGGKRPGLSVGMIRAAEDMMAASDRVRDGGPKASEFAAALRDFVRMVMAEKEEE